MKTQSEVQTNIQQAKSRNVETFHICKLQDLHLVMTAVYFILTTSVLPRLDLSLIGALGRH